MGKVFIDNFSSDAVDLKRKDRTKDNVLRILARNPRISTWDFSENIWLWKLVEELAKDDLVVQMDEPYPWHKYEITDKGNDYLSALVN